MNIFGHLIKDTEIIGISEITSREEIPGDKSTAVLSYHFRVYTKASSILITSPEFGKHQSESASAWLNNFCSIKQHIAAQIGEITTTS